MLLSFRKSCVSRNPELMPKRIIKRISCTNDSPKMFPINSTEKLPLTPRCQLKRKPLSGQQLLGPAKVEKGRKRERARRKRDSTATVYTANVTTKRGREPEAHLGRDSSERKMINLRGAEPEQGQVRRVICTNISLLRNG